MPFCRECGKPVDGSTKFCQECGSPQQPDLSPRPVPAPPSPPPYQPAPYQSPVVYAPPPAPAPMIYVEPSRHMSVGGFLVAILIIGVLFVVFLMFFARASFGSLCGIVVASPVPLGALLLALRRAKARIVRTQ